ncbi:MAG: hypothetical protein WBN94_09305 [Methanothrix sp.]
MISPISSGRSIWAAAAPPAGPARSRVAAGPGQPRGMWPQARWKKPIARRSLAGI